MIRLPTVASESSARLRAFISPLIEQENEVHGFTRAEVRELMAGIYARGDRLMLRFLFAHTAVAIGLAFFHHTWALSLTTSAMAVGMFWASARVSPRSFFTRCMAGIATQTFVALHIYQLHGLAEMHFFFFTGFTMMLVYQDGRSMWPGCFLIIAQHIVFAILHNQGVPLHFFEVAHISVTRLFFHFGIALVQVALCAYWSLLLRRQTLRDAWQKARLHESGRQLTDQLEVIRASEAALRESTVALTESNQRQRDILDNIPDLAWLKDREGRYVTVNATFLSAFTTTADAVAGRSDSDFFPKPFADSLRQRDAAVLATRRAVRFEEKYVDATGAWRDIDTILTPIVDSSGSVVGTMGIARDITDRVRAEEERGRLQSRMEQSQKLESLGVLAGGIAHDFNNLLVGILVNAELAKEMAGSDAELGEAVTGIATSARRAAELTQQMLAYAGRGQFVIEPVDLTVVVKETAALLKAAISKKAVLRFALGGNVPIVEADATQVRQVLMNLITNASEALGDREGLIEVSVQAVVLPASRLEGFRGSEGLVPGRYVAVSVRDSGCGMDAATIDRVFDPFFSTKFTGRGLGLAAVLGIVRSLGGGIRVLSAPGEGSTFSLILPAHAATVPEAGPVLPAPALVEFAGARVLLVDDDGAVRAVVGRLLAREGLRVSVAADGVEALDVLAADGGETRAVLLDILMPRKDGVETLAEIARTRPGLGVVMMSGFTESDAAQRLRGLSYTTFLHKPFDPDQLLASVRSAILASSAAEPASGIPR